MSLGAGRYPTGAGELQRLAASILSERRFHTSPVSQPGVSVLHWLNDLLGRLTAAIPGSGSPLLWIPAGALIVAATVALSRRALRHRSHRGPVARGALGPSSPDPSELERGAAAAEAEGLFDEAIRLRFRAGLLRLAARGAIEPRSSLRSAEVSRRLRSSEFDRLAASFDRVVYGHEPADRARAGAAREGWHRVLAEADR